MVIAFALFAIVVGVSGVVVALFELTRTFFKGIAED